MEALSGIKWNGNGADSGGSKDGLVRGVVGLWQQEIVSRFEGCVSHGVKSRVRSWHEDDLARRDGSAGSAGIPIRQRLQQNRLALTGCVLSATVPHALDCDLDDGSRGRSVGLSDAEHQDLVSGPSSSPGSVVHFPSL